VVACYRDDGLSELTDIEIYKELEPHGIAHAKWFISRETGPEVNLNTFLITYNTPDIPISIRIGHYNVRVNPYVPNPVLASNVRNLDMDKANAKSFLSSVRRRAMMVTLVKMITSVPIVANPVWPLLKPVHFT
jgi:hypothetical protein